MDSIILGTSSYTIGETQVKIIPFSFLSQYFIQF